MFVTPDEQYEAVIDTGETGLVGTIGLLLVDNQGGTTQAFSSATVVETPAGSGVYAATRIAPSGLGQFTIVWRRGVGGETLGVDELVVTGEASATIPPPTVGGVSLGPCSAWVDGDDVAACCKSSVGSDPSLFDTVAVEASMVMYELSGRLFSGLCARTVRPCRQACACFRQSAAAGLGSWFWTTGISGAAAWRNECGDRCGCGTESYVRLAGYPVRAIIQVKLDGAVLDPSEYRLVGHRKLLRTADPGPPVVNRVWPSCQNLALDDDQPGTYSITYTFGAEPPQVGRDAAAALACQLYAACDPGGAPCQLPNKVTTIIRQGITMDRIVPLASLLRSGATGIPALDAFIAAYNPTGMRRRSAVFSPDLTPFAREG